MDLALVDAPERPHVEVAEAAPAETSQDDDGSGDLQRPMEQVSAVTCYDAMVLNCSMAAFSGSLCRQRQCLLGNIAEKSNRIISAAPVPAGATHR
jgi:hypothetical protein